MNSDWNVIYQQKNVICKRKHWKFFKCISKIYIDYRSFQSVKSMVLIGSSFKIKHILIVHFMIILLLL